MRSPIVKKRNERKPDKLEGGELGMLFLDTWWLKKKKISQTMIKQVISEWEANFQLPVRKGAWLASTALRNPYHC